MFESVRFGLGVIILVVSAFTGGILIFAPGSIRLQRPDCGWAGWMFNILNLVFFMLLIPLCGLMMIRDVEMPFYICLAASGSSAFIIVRIIGILFFLAGSLLLLWSRISLRRSFRLAGVKPTQSDYLMLHGPYKHIRHPMYLSALLVLFGLMLILGSTLLLIMFVIMFLLIRILIPEEEKQLDQAYPVAYHEYCKRVPGGLLPRKHHS